LDVRSNQKPLVTFALIAYNQERFIEEAVEAALAQDYSPLEIILSDDCSTDRTFELMKDLTAKYQGPHRIVLNQNLKNQGIGEHVNTAMALSSGEFIVVAAGDDVSLPHRTSTLVDVWLDLNRPDVSIYSSYDNVDADGTALDQWAFPREHLKKDLVARIDGSIRVVGASHAWSRQLFEKFGRIEFDAVNEDNVIQFRAALSDGVLVIPEVLVRYRQHESNVQKIDERHAHLSSLRRRARVSFVYHRRTLAYLRNFEKDLENTIERGERDYTSELAMLKRKIAQWQLRIRFAEGGIGKRLACLYTVAREGLAAREFLRLFLRIWMPRVE
jgi:glycosyltransferase involved in cell wall biosynthesis